MKVNKFVQFMKLVCCSFDFDTKALIFTCVLANDRAVDITSRDDIKKSVSLNLT